MSEDRLTSNDVRVAIRGSGLTGRAVCLHSSFRSFGEVEGGPEAIVQPFLDEGCTLMVPTYSYWAWTDAPDDPELRPERNGWDYGSVREPAARPFSSDASEVSPEVGAIPAAVAASPRRHRGRNPGVSFSAVGSDAETLIRPQTAVDPFAPLRVLARLRGFVVMAGVGLERMTLLHAAEEAAGRVPFMRYALTNNGVVAFATGGCSEGFGNLMPTLEPLRTEALVGKSRWMIFPATEALQAAAAAIRADATITHCGDPECSRCDAAAAGGPLLTKPWRA
jgi:aminoglycoside N3'-acetyltransferase